MGIDKINNTTQVYNKPVSKTAAVKPVKTEKAEPVSSRKAPEKKKESSRPTVSQRIEEQTEKVIENNKKVKNAIAEVNKKMNQKTRCEFSYHEDTKRVSIKVIDSETEEVIREIPPEETLDMLSKMWEVAGILIDEQR